MEPHLRIGMRSFVAITSNILVITGRVHIVSRTPTNHSFSNCNKKDGKGVVKESRHGTFEKKHMDFTELVGVRTGRHVMSWIFRFDRKSLEERIRKGAVGYPPSPENGPHLAFIQPSS